MILQESITTHIYTIYIILAVMFFNLYSVLTISDFVKLAKRLRVMTPFYHMINAMIIYTGTIVSAYSKDMSLTVILMIACSIFIMVIEIKRYKKMRVIKVADILLQDEFRKFAKKVYILEISAIIFTYIISKIF